MTQETPDTNPFPSGQLTNEEIMQLAVNESDRGDPRIFMWVALSNGMLDEIAPLTEERGIEMRLELARELAKSALLLSGAEFITEEEGNRITHALHRWKAEVVEAGRALGMDLPDPLDPDEFGVPDA